MRMLLLQVSGRTIVGSAYRCVSRQCCPLPRCVARGSFARTASAASATGPKADGRRHYDRPYIWVGWSRPQISS
jgi:hypothetical protein